MKFVLDGNNALSLIKESNQQPVNKTPICHHEAFIIDLPRIRRSISLKNINTNNLHSVVLFAASGAGIFWDTFLKYIFPYMMDIAKVYCAIQIAKGFYDEKRGGKDSGTGISTFMTYGKWYLLFALTPYGVELIDELGNKMLTELRTNP